MLLLLFFFVFFFCLFFLWRNEEKISIYLAEKLAYLLRKPRCIHFIQLCNVMGNLFFNRNNFVKLNIFYESLNFETIEEEPLIDVRHLSRDTAFSTRLHVLQAMTQISLRECAGWSELLLGALWVAKHPIFFLRRTPEVLLRIRGYAGLS